jgi:hypothetical protein
MSDNRKNMLIKQTRVNKELLFEFFLTFLRFEYALKASDFFQRLNTERTKGFKPPNAQPDWYRFAVSLRDSFCADKTDELSEACDYIIHSPPYRQVIINDDVAWETPIRPEGEEEIEFILKMIRCIRNNLFHGGKYNIEVHETIERTEKLLTSSLIILKECLALSTAVGNAFDQAII